MTISSLDPADTRVLEAPVAGVAALFVAKARKLVERLDEPKGGRVKAKDASDIYRMMITQSARDVGARLRELSTDDAVGPAASQGVQDLVRLFESPRSPGVDLAVAALAAGAVPAATVQAVTVAYVAEMRGAYESTTERGSSRPGPASS
jgi:hypothetical protein